MKKGWQSGWVGRSKEYPTFENNKNDAPLSTFCKYHLRGLVCLLGFDSAAVMRGSRLQRGPLRWLQQVVEWVWHGGGSCGLTLGHHFAKHWHGLQSGAVPPTVAKLKLTLVYSQLGSATHCVHHLHTALTDLHLKEAQETNKQTKKLNSKVKSNAKEMQIATCRLLWVSWSDAHHDSSLGVWPVWEWNLRPFVWATCRWTLYNQPTVNATLV